jgi:fucose 4-O-acetylase-like acetyltransferase
MMTSLNIYDTCVMPQGILHDPAANAPLSLKAAREPRITGIDALKGGAILLVVLGHVIQSHIDQFDNNIVFRLIYSFHMPLFMVLSGWFADPGKPQKLRKTFVRLVPPVFAWLLIAYVVLGQYRTTSLVELFEKWIKSPDVGLWFLWVLFLCHLWLALVWKLAARLGPAAYMIGALALCPILVSEFGLPLAKYYFPFFALGYIASQNWTQCSRYRHVAAGIGILVFLLAFPHWQRNHTNLHVVYFHLANHVIEISKILYFANREACALSGSVAFAYLLTAVAHGKLEKILAWFGTQTLEIYVIHQLLTHFAFGQGAVAVISALIITTTLSLCAIWLLRKNAWASLVLFGRIPIVESRRALVSTLGRTERI